MPTATTSYPCCVSALGGFRRSWLHAAHRGAKISLFLKLAKAKKINPGCRTKSRAKTEILPVFDQRHIGGQRTQYGRRIY